MKVLPGFYRCGLTVALMTCWFLAGCVSSKPMDPRQLCMEHATRASLTRPQALEIIQQQAVLHRSGPSYEDDIVMGVDQITVHRQHYQQTRRNQDTREAEFMVRTFKTVDITYQFRWSELTKLETFRMEGGFGDPLLRVQMTFGKEQFSFDCTGPDRLHKAADLVMAIETLAGRSLGK